VPGRPRNRAPAPTTPATRPLPLVYLDPVPASSKEPPTEARIEAALAAARAAPARVHAASRGLDEPDARRKPGVGKLSLFEHMAHLLDMEREVFGVRLRRVLAEEHPRLEPVDQEHLVDTTRWGDRTFASLLGDWEHERAVNLSLVEGTGPEQWARTCRHPDLGPGATFADLVERWARHDAEHLRQMEIVAMNCRERNLP